LRGKALAAISRTIIDGAILPNFRRGDCNAGALAGTASVLSVLGGGSVTRTEAESSSAGAPSNWGFPLVIMIFFIFMLLRNPFRVPL
jgi:uncharacterized membrane protein YgcG